MNDTEKKYSSDEIKKFFGNKLKKLRQNAGMTRKELAGKLGITEISVGNYERGLREPALEKLIVLSNLFCVSIEELIGADDTLFKNKITDNYRQDFLINLFSYGHLDVIETVDGEFALVDSAIDLFRMDFETYDKFKLLGEIVFFSSLDELIDFFEHIIISLLSNPSKSLRESFPQIVQHTLMYMASTSLYGRALNETTFAKLKNGKIWKGTFHIPHFSFLEKEKIRMTKKLKNKQYF